MNDHQFHKLLDIFGYSWKGYRRVRKGVIKRLIRHMAQLNIRNADDYLELCKTVPGIRNETRRLLTVSISSFFRDRPLWEYIKQKMILQMTAGNPDQVAVWSAGCALGQEVYSFKMLWRILEDEADPLPPLFVTATDINRDYLDRAAAGEYDSQTLKDVPEDLRERFFYRDQERYFVRGNLKENITWRLQDLEVSALEKNFFDLIFLRNSLLTYRRKEYHEGIIKRITPALTRKGFLVIGARETMPAGNMDLFRVEDFPGVFRSLLALETRIGTCSTSQYGE